MITIAHEQKYSIPYRDESVVEVLCGLWGAGIVIAFVDPTEGSWSDDMMVSNNKCGTLYTSQIVKKGCYKCFIAW